MLEGNLTLLEAEFGSQYELLVVDDGSTDASQELAREFDVQVLSHPDAQNHGKGATVRLGMLAAKGSYRVFADADGSYDPETVLRLIDTVGGAIDIAVAHRADTGHATTLRSVGHTMLERVCNGIAPTDSIDTQAGAKAFTASAADTIWPMVKATGFGADREAMYVARRMGYRVANVPAEVTAMPDSHVRPVRDGTRLIVDTIRARARQTSVRI
jgi:glycosyltransferase involved in cell wall biosynthesis